MSNLVILAVYHSNRSGQRLLLEAQTLNEKRLLRDSVSGGIYTHRKFAVSTPFWMDV